MPEVIREEISQGPELGTCITGTRPRDMHASDQDCAYACQAPSEPMLIRPTITTTTTTPSSVGPNLIRP